jgi:hypothetical protein
VDLSGDAWTAIGLGITSVGGIATAYLGYRAKIEATKANRSATSANNNAVLAKDFSEPTANGFASKVLASLAALEAGQQSLVRSQQHAAERFDRHLEHHDRDPKQ